jgi:hypothetical protein
MAGKQYIDFEHGTDTGERTDSDSIQPIIDGESVLGAVLNRPPENLRYRTELLRAFGDDTLYRLDSDRWIITGGTAAGVGAAAPVLTSWSSTTGIFVTTGDMVLQPLMGPNTDVNEVGTFPIVDGGLSATFTVTTTRRAYAHGNESRIIFEEAPTAELPGGNVAATLEGSPLHTLRVIVRDDGLTTVTQVYNAIVALGGGATVGMTIVLTGDAATKIDLDLIPAEYHIWQATKVADRELNHIPASSFAAFFVTSANRLADGDSIGIYFPYMVDPTGNSGGRRESTVTTTDPGSGSPPNTGVAYTQLFNSRVHPEYLPYAIPLCRRIGTSLIFVDGTVVEATATDPRAFGSGHIVAHLHHSPHASADTFDITAGSVQSVLQALQLFVNDKASLDAVETVTGAWTITGALKYASAYYYTPTPTPIEGSITLLWRYPEVANASVDWDTISAYLVKTSSAVSGINSTRYVIVNGATLEWQGSGHYHVNIHTAPVRTTGDTGYVSVNVLSHGKDEGTALGECITGWVKFPYIAGNTTFTLAEVSPIQSAVASYPALAATVAVGVYHNFHGASVAAGSELVLAAGGGDLAYHHNINRKVTYDYTLTGTHAAKRLSTDLDCINGSSYRVFNRVLNGMCVRPANTDSTYPDDRGRWPLNYISIGRGRAIVNGGMYYDESGSAIADVMGAMTPGTAALIGLTTECKWFGVYLRSDGNYRIGPLPSSYHQNNTGIVGGTLHLIPDANKDSHYGQIDYTLVDVIWKYQGTDSSTARFANVEHVAGNLHLIPVAKVYDYGSSTFTNTLNPDIVMPSTTTQVQLQLETTAPSTYSGDRTIGVPRISDRALFAVYFDILSGSTAGSTSSMGLSSGHSGTAPNDHGDPYLWGYRTLWSERAHGDTQYRQGNSIVDLPIIGRNMDHDGSNSYVYASASLGTGGSVSGTISLLGFFWDRFCMGVSAINEEWFTPQP